MHELRSAFMALDGTFLSEEAFMALPVTTWRVELFDGEVEVELPSPTVAHQRACMVLASALARWARLQPLEATVMGLPLDVRFGPSRILQPDIQVWLEPLPSSTPTPVTRIPDLCIEVLSERHDFERMAKRLVYAQAGVIEMWTVALDPLRVERWTGTGLATREECATRVESPLLRGFALDVASLLAG